MTDHHPTLITERQLYALSIFAWCKAHYWATLDDFKDMLGRVEKQIERSSSVTFITSAEVAEKAWEIGPDGIEALIRRARVNRG